MGHAVHSLLANEAQPFEYASYSPFIAETASITNEMLLSDYMVAHAKTEAEKLFYLGKALELIRVDFFRQTLFAEFQLAIHDEMEKGGTISGERMTDMYCGLLKKYYGDSQGVTEGGSRLLRGMDLHPAFLLRLLCLPKCDIDGRRRRVHRRTEKGRRPRASAFHRDAESRQFGLPLHAVQKGRSRHGDARALRGTDCTHDPHHGPDRSDQSKEVGVGIEPSGRDTRPAPRRRSLEAASGS